LKEAQAEIKDLKQRLSEKQDKQRGEFLDRCEANVKKLQTEFLKEEGHLSTSNDFLSLIQYLRRRRLVNKISQKSQVLASKLAQFPKQEFENVD